MGHVCYVFQTRTKLVCRPAASCRGVQNITILQKKGVNTLFDRGEVDVRCEIDAKREHN